MALVITLIDPQVASEVEKQGGLTFKVVEDTTEDIATLTATVNGKLVYNLASSFLTLGWYASTIERIDGAEGKGYQVSLIPDRLATWRNRELIRLKISAVDTLSNEDQSTWDFVAVPRIVPPIFNYVVESIRNEDIKD